MLGNKCLYCYISNKNQARIGTVLAGAVVVLAHLLVPVAAIWMVIKNAYYYADVHMVGGWVGAFNEAHPTSEERADEAIKTAARQAAVDQLVAEHHRSRQFTQH